MALGLESEFKSASDDRVPTEVSSARLLRATKSQLNLTGLDDLDGAHTAVDVIVSRGGRRADDDFVTVRL